MYRKNIISLNSQTTDILEGTMATLSFIDTPWTQSQLSSATSPFDSIHDGKLIEEKIQRQVYFEIQAVLCNRCPL